MRKLNIEELIEIKPGFTLPDPKKDPILEIYKDKPKRKKDQYEGSKEYWSEE